MLRNEIYDSQGQDGQDNKAAWEKLPKIARYFFSSQQTLINSRLEKGCRRIFGESGLEDLIKTSGWRSVIVNNRHSGKTDSLHLIGLASDYRKVGRFLKIPPPHCDQLEVFDSGDCWHFQMKRG